MFTLKLKLGKRTKNNYFLKNSTLARDLAHGAPCFATSPTRSQIEGAMRGRKTIY